MFVRDVVCLLGLDQDFLVLRTYLRLHGNVGLGFRVLWSRFHTCLGVVSLVNAPHFLLVPAVVRVVAVSLVEGPLFLI